MSASEPRLPDGIRDGVREGILTALSRDVEMRGARTAGRLISAGVVGVLGAIGAMLLVTGHPFGHHPYWHATMFSALWAGLLVVSLSLVLLQVRTPQLPLARAAGVGLFALGLAGLCRLLCPDQHILGWWFQTGTGAVLAAEWGTSISTLCLGTVTTFVFAALPAATLYSITSSVGWLGAASASCVFLLLFPGVVLECVGAPPGALAGWIGGAAVGAYAGVASGLTIARRLRRS